LVCCWLDTAGALVGGCVGLGRAASGAVLPAETADRARR
jgi:hypothetical protein